MRRYIQKKQRAFMRWSKRRIPALLLMFALPVAGCIAYAQYMAHIPPSIDPLTCKPLLDLIARAESNGNYNAYFGASHNNSIDFTSMSIADVLQWQKEYVAGGSPSSAVGRYQILNTTLQGLVNRLGINPSQKFDQKTQDTLAVALLEKRGIRQYVNKELSGTDFAANIAKEWAGLPKVVGKNPDQSYYAGDGINASQVAPEDVLKALEPIQAQ